MKKKQVTLQSKFESQSCFYIDYSDFDELVNEHYGMSNNDENNRYSVLADLECTDHRYFSAVYFNVKKEKFDKWDKELFEQVTTKGYGDNHHGAHLILRDLCNKGILAPGKYVISVDW